MSTKPVIETRLQAWLSTGPETAPEDLLRAVLAAVPTTSRQDRGGFWPPHAPRALRLMALVGGIVAVVAVAAVGLIPLAGLNPLAMNQTSMVPSPGGARTAPPSVSPSPRLNLQPPSLDTAAWDSFTSDWFGLTFGYPPGGWYLHPAAGPWPLDTDPKALDSYLDLVESNGLDGSAFWAVSQPVPRDVNEIDWLTSFRSKAGTRSVCYPPADQQERVTIDARRGYLLQSRSCGFFQAFAFVDGRVYVLTGQGFWNPDQGPPMERALFDAFLTTVRFDPAAAR